MQIVTRAPTFVSFKLMSIAPIDYNEYYRIALIIAGFVVVGVWSAEVIVAGNRPVIVVTGED